MVVLAPTRLSVPLSEERVRALALGEQVLISGRIFTGRDRFHKYVFEGGSLPVDLREGALYHCGPVVLPHEKGGWKVIAAGPTTSFREEPYMAEVIKRCGIRLIIGKGGMGAATRSACAKHGAVYLQTTGGAAQVLARCIKTVAGGYLIDEFGPSEAMWEFEVVDFPALVAIDARGQSLYEKVEECSRQTRDKLIATFRAVEPDKPRRPQ